MSTEKNGATHLIGFCPVLIGGMTGIYRVEGNEGVSVTVSQIVTSPVMWVTFEQCRPMPDGHLMKGFGNNKTIVEFDETQVKELINALQESLVIMAYGQGLAEMGGL